MNHKRKKPKNARSGCLMCKPHKMNHAEIRTRAQVGDQRRIDAAEQEVAEAVEDLHGERGLQLP